MYVCVCVCVRERERDTHTHRDRERETERELGRLPISNREVGGGGILYFMYINKNNIKIFQQR